MSIESKGVPGLVATSSDVDLAMDMVRFIAMSDGISTREFAMDDYEAALELWQRVEGLEIAEGDDRKSVALFVQQNPGLSRVALDGTKIIGVAMCGHDGRRGYIYHLAVDPDCQRTGLGKRLVDECLDGLGKAGLQRVL